jgi:sugar phosphate isomerase/epimerase
MVDFSLAHLTAIELAPPELVTVAARTGYRYVGLRLLRATPELPGYPLMDDKPGLRETKARMDATGIGLLDIELVRITPDTEVPSLESFIAAGAELGGRHIITAPYDPDLNRLADRLAAIADLASPYGLSPVLEFFPWTLVPNLATAVGVVEAAARPNCGILIDTLHFDRSDSTYEQIDRIPASRLPYVHVADAPAEKPTTTDGMLHQARSERLPAGEGGIDLVAILSHLPSDIPVALEVPMQRLTQLVGPEEVARRVREAASRVLANIRNTA